MKNQRGVALSGLLFWGIIIALLAVLAMKVAPEYISYFKIAKATKAIASSSNGKTVQQLRTEFAKYMDVDHVDVIGPSDLDISKDGNRVVIAFTYERRIPLFYNVSLLIDFEGSSAGRD